MKALGQMLGVNQPTKRPSKSAKIFFLMNALDFLRPHRRPTLKGSRETNKNNCPQGVSDAQHRKYPQSFERWIVLKGYCTDVSETRNRVEKMSEPTEPRVTIEKVFLYQFQIEKSCLKNVSWNLFFTAHVWSKGSNIKCSPSNPLSL